MKKGTRSALLMMVLAATILFVGNQLWAKSAGLPDLGFDSPFDTSEAGLATNRGFGGSLLNLVAGDYDTITVAVRNYGQVSIDSTVVRFYLGDPLLGGSPLGSDITVGRIYPGMSIKVKKVWDTLGRSGRNDIYVVIDPDGHIEETDKTNNSLKLIKPVFLLGDFDQDGKIDTTDQRAIFEHLGKKRGDPGWSSVYDIWTPALPFPEPPNFRAFPDGYADQADHVVFSRMMDFNLQSTLAYISFDHGDHVVFNPGEMTLETVSTGERKFVLGDPVLITVRFPTVGSAEVGKIRVTFYDGNPTEGGTKIGEDSYIFRAIGGIGVAYTVWKTEGTLSGRHKIFAVADPYNEKIESRKDNNIILEEITLSEPVSVNEPENNVNLPTAFKLSQNYPNPFNTSTVISFELPVKATIKLVITDVLGRQVKILTEGDLRAGRWNLTWDGKDNHGRDLASGVYLYSLIVKGNEWEGQIRRMILLK